MIQTAHTTRSRPVAAHRRSLTGSLAREARAVRVWHTTKATGDDDRAVPGGLLAGGLKNALGFFKARMDEMMEDEEEALVTRVVQRSRDEVNEAASARFLGCVAGGLPWLGTGTLRVELAA